MLFALSCTFCFFFPAKNKSYNNHKAIISLSPECPDQYLFVGSMQQSVSALIQKREKPQGRKFPTMQKLRYQLQVLGLWSKLWLQSIKLPFFLCFSHPCYTFLHASKHSQTERAIEQRSFQERTMGREKKMSPFLVHVIKQLSCKLPSLFF